MYPEIEPYMTGRLQVCAEALKDRKGAPSEASTDPTGFCFLPLSLSFALSGVAGAQPVL